MRKIIRFTEKYFEVMVTMLLLLMMILFFASCTTTKYVSAENTTVDSVYINVTQRDSIFVQDSVYVHEKADTVFVTRWHIEYRDALRIDTFYIERVDSVNHIVEVEREFSKIEELKMNVGAGVLWAIPILIGLFILYRKLLK